MSYYSIFIIIPFAVILPFYLNAEKREEFKKATILKLILGLLCVLCALSGFLFSGAADLSESSLFDGIKLLVVIALIFAVIGDYFVQFINLDIKKSGIGVACFSVTQIFLILSLSLKHGISTREFIATAIVFAILYLTMKSQDWKLEKALVPLSIYMLLVIFMMNKAVLALIGSAGIAGVGSGISVPVLFMAAGAVLFFLSDLLLGISTYKPNNKVRIELKLSAYFCGLMLIAMSNS